jgi:hypothetical protein
MKELDLLKRDWQKNDAFNQVSEVEIYKMLHAKSSSIVKWILIVSILEFVILNGIALFLSDETYNTIMNLHPFLSALEKVNYLIILVFIYLFYRNYKAISVLNAVKTLLKHILKTRKIVTCYIYWNIFIGGISGALAGIEAFNKGLNIKTPSNTKVVIEINYFTLLLSMFFTMGIIFLFYKILYGGFLKKLKQNYTELKKIDL